MQPQDESHGFETPSAPWPTPHAVAESEMGMRKPDHETPFWEDIEDLSKSFNHPIRVYFQSLHDSDSSLPPSHDICAILVKDSGVQKTDQVPVLVAVTFQ